MVAGYIPDRGDIVWLNFSPQQGHEQAGLRPAIVLSPKSYNQSSKLMLACPITSKVKHYPFEVRVKANRIDGVVLADQVKSLDWTMRNTSFVEKASYEVLEQTQELIETLLRD
ncbi:MAG TPA: endoribonuclease MazF [Patescibacteria group bacterium]|jgi:mRNA interferase MazF|nr:endoribonuclease MazF [Patescibacteria group bacterium]